MKITNVGKVKAYYTIVATTTTVDIDGVEYYVDRSHEENDDIQASVIVTRTDDKPSKFSDNDLEVIQDYVFELEVDGIEYV